MRIDGNDMHEKRKLNLLWHAVLPAGILAMLAAAYLAARFGLHQPPPLDDVLSELLPAVFAVAVLFGVIFALVLKNRFLPLLVSRAQGTAAQRATVAMFTLLGAADAPPIIGIALFMLAPADWLATAIACYALVAAVVFKPDFDNLLAMGASANR